MCDTLWYWYVQCYVCMHIHVHHSLLFYFPSTQPLSSSLTRSTFPSQHVGSPAIQVQYIESLIKDTAEELR